METRDIDQALLLVLEAHTDKPHDISWHLQLLSCDQQHKIAWANRKELTRLQALWQVIRTDINFFSKVKRILPFLIVLIEFLIINVLQKGFDRFCIHDESIMMITRAHKVTS